MSLPYSPKYLEGECYELHLGLPFGITGSAIGHALLGGHMGQRTPTRSLIRCHNGQRACTSGGRSKAGSLRGGEVGDPDAFRVACGPRGASRAGRSARRILAHAAVAVKEPPSE